MQGRQLEVAKWQTTLETTFGGVRGNVGTHVQFLYEQERTNVQLTKARCQGFMTLMQSFFDFAVRTSAEVQTHDAVLNAYNIAFNVAALRRMRVGLLAFEHGYYFDGASHLRAVFENTMYLGAVLRGMCWFDELHSFARAPDLAAVSADELRKVQHKHVMGVDRRVSSLMYGENSELSPGEQAQIRHFLKMQHMHVHRGESNAASFIVEMIRDGKMPSIAPGFEMERASIFANTAACAAWTAHRVLQYMSEPGRNSPQWHDQWKTLDNALRFWVSGWESPLASPFIRMMDTSFAFVTATALSQLHKTQAGIRES